MKVKHLLMLVGLLIIVLLLNGCATKKARPYISKPVVIKVKSIRKDKPIIIKDEPIDFKFCDDIYVVKTWKYDRDCLWNIALRKYGAGNKYMIIYIANQDQIINPHLIYPGQKLTIPAEN